jgi:hypothetical protein
VADYRSVGLFDQIPAATLTSISNLRVVFRHASVGTTINNALDCLQGTRTNPKECTLYPDYKYDRKNWVFQARPNSGWFGKIDDFVTEVKAQKNSFDIFTFKFCYLDGLDGLQDPCGSTFSPQKVKKAWDYYRTKMNSLEDSNPGKIFVWITIPLTQVGQYCTDTLNSLIRNYCTAERKILFDLADIECHDHTGVLHKNSKGWQIAYSPFCGEQQEGAQSCHPNWEGSIRIAKAFWWLMSEVYSSFNTSAEKKEIEFPDELRIFPCPASRNLHISQSKNQDSSNLLEIYTVPGELVYQCRVNLYDPVDLNIGFLSTGIYYLRISGKEKVSCMKIVVMK